MSDNPGKKAALGILNDLKAADDPRYAPVILIPLVDYDGETLMTFMHYWGSDTIDMLIPAAHLPMLEEVERADVAPDDALQVELPLKPFVSLVQRLNKAFEVRPVPDPVEA